MNGKTDIAANTLDYSVVNSYWKKADLSNMGPYMMDGFGFPASAGRFRFHAESVIVQQLIRNAKVDITGAVLDLGSGVGYWAEFFALKFKKVIAVEASTRLYETMVQRCSSYDNITPIHEDVLSFEPEGRFSLFLRFLLSNTCWTVRVQKLNSACAFMTKRPQSRTRIAEMTAEGVSLVSRRTRNLLRPDTSSRLRIRIGFIVRRNLLARSEHR